MWLDPHCCPRLLSIVHVVSSVYVLQDYYRTIERKPTEGRQTTPTI